MNMFDFIDKLRKKPLAERKMIALTISASITGIIFFVWLSTFRISPVSNESNSDSFSNIATPLASIKENATGIYSSFVKIIDAGQKSSSSSSDL